MRNRALSDLDRVVALGGGHGLGRVLSALSLLRLALLVLLQQQTMAVLLAVSSRRRWHCVVICAITNQLITEPSVASAMFEYRFSGTGELV